MRFHTAILLLILPFSAIGGEKRVLCDSCVLNGHLRDTNMTSFVIKVEDALYSPPLFKDVVAWQGSTPGTPPNRATCMVTLRIGGIAVFIPYSAYADLGNPDIPNGVSLTQGENALNLYIRGGEDANAYIAKFVVVNGKLTKRELVPANSTDSAPQVMTFNGNVKLR